MRMNAGALLLPLIAAPLFAQEAPQDLPQVLPQPGDVPAVDTITPVPPPSLPFGGPAEITPAVPKEVTIDNRGGKVEFDNATGVLRYGGPVKVTTDTKIEIFADTAVIDTKAKTVTMTGNVSVYQGNLLQRGDRAIYFWERKYLDASGLRASMDPLILEAGKFTATQDGSGRQVFIGDNAGVTTDDEEDPGYWIRASRTTVYPGDRAIFRDLKVYAGDTPVFWLPYLSQPLHKDLGYHFIPGSRSNWGPYLLNTYGIMLGGERDPETGDNRDAWLLSKWHFDLRATRGVGTGVDLIDTRQEDNPNLGWLKLYYLPDMDPSIQRSGIPRVPIDNDRYSAQLRYRVPFETGDHADWRADFNLTALSDQYYLEDFDPKIYRTDPSPDNTVGIFRNDGKSLASLFTRVRVNDFYRSDERLPELAFDQARAPLFGTPILHEGTTSLGSYSEHPGDPTLKSVILPLLTMPSSDPRFLGLMSQLSGYERELLQQIRALPPGSPALPSLTNQLLDPGFERFHTYHEFSLPLNVGGWLSLTPEAGIGYGRYWNVSGDAASIDRTFLETGAEASVKFSKDLGDYHDRALGLDGLVHVVQPYARWSLVATDDLDSTFPKIDRLTFSTRPRTLDLARFTAIDDIKDWNILRFGTRNRLLTLRDGQSYEWLYLDTYMDAFIEDPELDRKFSNLYNDVHWRPLPWLGVDVETQFPVVSDGSGFSEFSTRVRFLPTPDFEFSIGHRLLNNHPVLIDSNRIDFRAFARINDHWGIGMLQQWELDDSTLEVEQYTLHRDFGNWVAGVGLTHRNNRVDDEYGVMFSLTLKDFPSVSLPFELDAE